MEEEMKSKIEAAVMEILKKSDTDDMSEFKVQSLVAKKLGIDLSHPDSQQLIIRVIESFLLSMEGGEEPVPRSSTEEGEIKESSEDDEEVSERTLRVAAKDCDKFGNLIACKLMSKGKEEMIQDFEGKATFGSSISDYHQRNEMKGKIEETVMEILGKAEIEETSEFEVPHVVADMLGMDLSSLECQQFVRRTIESFLLSIGEEPVPHAPMEETETMENAEEEEQGNKTNSSIAAKDYDKFGNATICKLSRKRKVTVQDFEGKTLVSIPECHPKEAKQFPSTKETKKKIEETVMEIMQKAEMGEMSELKVENVVAEKLGMDLSDPACQQLVRSVIESFLSM